MFFKNHCAFEESSLSIGRVKAPAGPLPSTQSGLISRAIWASSGNSLTVYFCTSLWKYIMRLLDQCATHWPMQGSGSAPATAITSYLGACSRGLDYSADAGRYYKRSLFSRLLPIDAREQLWAVSTKQQFLMNAWDFEMKCINWVAVRFLLTYARNCVPDCLLWCNTYWIQWVSTNHVW